MVSGDKRTGVNRPSAKVVRMCDKLGGVRLISAMLSIEAQEPGVNMAFLHHLTWDSGIPI